MTNNDTICAISTAPGVGGIAVARISGPKAIEICDRIWKGKRRLSAIPPNSCTVGSVLDTQLQPLDQAVATVFHAPHSFTGDDVVEISVHGSRWVQQELILSLIKTGARMAEAGEFTQRAFANGRMDLTQAEAIADLIASTSRASQRLALSQMRGGFSKGIEDMRRQLLELAALLELELDFSEEDVEFASRTRLEELATQVRDTTSRLADGFATGQAIRQGIPVAIVGATNAGKSSILNALIHDERAIVSDIHGTTRDIVEELVTIGDYTIRLKDTAGIRHTDDTIEALGIQRSRQALNSATIILLVIDNTATIEQAPWNDIRATIADNPAATLIIAANKCDIAPSSTSFPIEPHHIISTSAATGEGIEQLRNAINNTINQLAKEGACGDTLVSNARHYQALREASAAASGIIDALRAGLPGDLVAQDLRQCIDALSAITGAISTPEILATIFSRFCIGK